MLFMPICHPCYELGASLPQGQEKVTTAIPVVVHKRL